MTDCNNLAHLSRYLFFLVILGILNMRTCVILTCDQIIENSKFWPHLHWRVVYQRYEMKLFLQSRDPQFLRLLFSDRSMAVRYFCEYSNRETTLFLSNYWKQQILATSTLRHRSTEIWIKTFSRKWRPSNPPATVFRSIEGHSIIFGNFKSGEYLIFIKFRETANFDHICTHAYKRARME